MSPEPPCSAPSPLLSPIATPRERPPPRPRRLEPRRHSLVLPAIQPPRHSGATTGMAVPIRRPPRSPDRRKSRINRKHGSKPGRNTENSRGSGSTRLLPHFVRPIGRRWTRVPSYTVHRQSLSGPDSLLAGGHLWTGPMLLHRPSPFQIDRPPRLPERPSGPDSGCRSMRLANHPLGSAMSIRDRSQDACRRWYYRLKVRNSPYVMVTAPG
jgi:hypothetical protein